MIHTFKISEYVYYHPQPIVKQIPLYVKDTSDFISKVESVETVPDKLNLVSLDVNSFYTNISNSEGIKAVKVSLDDFPRNSNNNFCIINSSVKQLRIQL